MFLLSPLLQSRVTLRDRLRQPCLFSKLRFSFSSPFYLSSLFFPLISLLSIKLYKAFVLFRDLTLPEFVILLASLAHSDSLYLSTISLLIKTTKARRLTCYLCFRSPDTSLAERSPAAISLYLMVQVELTKLDLIIRFITLEKREKNQLF